MAKTKQKMANIEFMRAVCSLVILVFHFSETVISYFKPLCTTANSNWGGTVVTLFFIMSGAMLYLNNSEIPSLKVFYYKRFKSVYPTFYLTYFFFFMLHVIDKRKFFFISEISPFTLIYTLLGIDGYVSSYGIRNYYIIGEWFLGALIILYFIYPALRYGIENKTVFTSVAVTVLYAGVLLSNVFENVMTNIFSCMFSFYMGMLLFKYRKILKSVPVFLTSSAVFIFLTLYKLPVGLTDQVRSLIDHISGLCFFIMLFWIGEFLTRPKPLRTLFEKLGAISFPIFLLQHRVILYVTGKYNPIGIKDYMLELIIILAVTLSGSWLSWYITRKALSSGWYKDFENMILKKNNN